MTKNTLIQQAILLLSEFHNRSVLFPVKSLYVPLPIGLNQSLFIFCTPNTYQYIDSLHQTCDSMTSLKSTVETEWQKILNEEAVAAQTGTRFNFYTSLKNMAAALDNNLPSNFFNPFWNSPNNYGNTSTILLWSN